MTGGLRVSVIVPTFDRARYLRACVESLLAQSVRPDEILVVDDGSRDETPAVVASFGERVRYLRQENAGKSAALNLGLGHARGELLWFFDDDDVALPDSLAQRLEVLRREPEADFVYSDCYVARERRDGRLRIVDRVTAAPHGDGLLLAVLRSFSFFQQSLLVRRDCIERIGAFDTRYLRCQDYEFIIRLVRECRGAYLPEPTFIQREHAGPRGPARLRHEPGERVATWMLFNRMLAEELHATLALGEYLVPPRRTTELGPEERRTALVNRIGVYATKGHVALLAADIVRLGVLAGAGSGPGPLRLTAAEVRQLVRSAGHKHLRLALAEGASLAALIMPRAGETPAGIVREIAACFALALANPRCYVRPANRERLALARNVLRLTRLAGSAAPRVAARGMRLRGGIPGR